MAELLGLSGVVVDVVEREADGSWTVHVSTAPGSRGCCPGCGQAGRVKEAATHSMKHLVVAPMRVTWHKQRLRCANTSCTGDGFAESGPVAEAGARVSTPARAVMGHLVGEWLVPVSRVAAGAGVGWHTVHDAFVGVAEQAGIHLTDTTTVTGEAGSQAATGTTSQAGTSTDIGSQAATEAGTTSQASTAGAAAGVQAGGEPARLRRGVSGLLPPVEVLGLDDHRRGRALSHRDRASGKWVADADRWQTVFVDTAGGHGLLGQAEGRAKADATAWLATADPTWRAGVRYVSIDMSSVYKSAATSGLLPNAEVVVDLFHVIQLATKTVDGTRRRVTYARHGRRARAGDLEYTVKNPLRRGQERLSKTARNKLLCALADLGDAGRQIGAAWRAKELLRDLTKLSPSYTGHATTRHQVSNALTKFFTFAATTGANVPEVQTLAETISTWRNEITRAVLTGHTNAAAEAVNRGIKLLYRTAYGFTNVTNQQRRSRYAASRTTRPHWLHTATTQTSQPVTT